MSCGNGRSPSGRGLELGAASQEHANFDLATTKHAHCYSTHRGCAHALTILDRTKMAPPLGLPKLSQLQCPCAGLIPQECSDDSDNTG